MSVLLIIKYMNNLVAIMFVVIPTVHKSYSLRVTTCTVIVIEHDTMAVIGILFLYKQEIIYENNTFSLLSL